MRLMVLRFINARMARVKITYNSLKFEVPGLKFEVSGENECVALVGSYKARLRTSDHGPWNFELL